MDGSVCLAIGTHEGDAATGEANGSGTGDKVMKPAWVREGMDESNRLAYPSRSELANKLFGESRHAIPGIGRVHEDTAMPLPVEGVLGPP
jgi:hypothetical protein